METYIRDKYERKKFMNASERQKLELEEKSSGSKSFTASQSNKYSSMEYLPDSISDYDQDRYSYSLKQLYDMGFKSTISNLSSLKASQGDIAQAIEYLIASGHNTTSNQNQSHRQTKPDSAYALKAQKLKDMGFKTDELINEALNETNTIEEAINYMVQRSRNSPSPSNKMVNLFSFDDDEFENSSKSSHHSVSNVENTSSKSELEDIFFQSSEPVLKTNIAHSNIPTNIPPKDVEIKKSASNSASSNINDNTILNTSSKVQFQCIN